MAVRKIYTDGTTNLEVNTSKSGRVLNLELWKSDEENFALNITLAADDIDELMKDLKVCFNNLNNQ